MFHVLPTTDQYRPACLRSRNLYAMITFYHVRLCPRVTNICLYLETQHQVLLVDHEASQNLMSSPDKELGIILPDCRIPCTEKSVYRVPRSL